MTRLLLVILVTSAFAAEALAHSSGTDSHLCPFPVDVQLLRSSPPRAETAVLAFTLEGPIRILLRNESTKRTVILDSTGTYSVDGRSGNVRFHGHNVWYWGLGQMPFLVTDGDGAVRRSPLHVVAGRPARSRDRPVRAPRAVAAGHETTRDACAVARTPLHAQPHAPRTSDSLARRSHPP